jgi:hypothetical protein
MSFLGGVNERQVSGHDLLIIFSGLFSARRSEKKPETNTEAIRARTAHLKVRSSTAH